MEAFGRSQRASALVLGRAVASCRQGNHHGHGDVFARMVTRGKRLVSFLGTGRYEPTRHRFPDESVGQETKYVCRAVAEFARVDEIAVVVTTEAKSAHGEAIVEELRSANLPAPSFHPIPKGESEAEL